MANNKRFLTRIETESMGTVSRRHGWRTGIGILLSIVLTFALLWIPLTRTDSDQTVSYYNPNIMDTYESYLANRTFSTLRTVSPEAAVPLQREYRLNDSDMVAPEPDQSCFGQTDDPASLEQLLEEASALLDGQSTLFTPETQIKEGSTVYYYLDETIFAVTWKQVVDDGVYTFSEVKIAHPSQFRRFLSNGKYCAGVLHTTTEMSESVNAVVASSGDYYEYRTIGIVVNEGHVYRGRGHFLDTCYIDDKGDLLFTYAGEYTDEAAVQEYVDQHNVRFSLSFGPVMILDGEYRVPDTYNSGEINDPYARAALCQMGELHYVVVAANTEDPHYALPTVGKFAMRLLEMGIPVAYALDGGQTAAIAMNDQLINTVSYGSQRGISDIIYFATAVPLPQTQEVPQ